jgi:hypothetical protein
MSANYQSKLTQFFKRLWRIDETTEQPELASVKSPPVTSPQVLSSLRQATKPCPFCAEDILVAAIKCKHCGSTLNGEAGIMSAKQRSKLTQFFRRLWRIDEMPKQVKSPSIKEGTYIADDASQSESQRTTPEMRRQEWANRTDVASPAHQRNRFAIASLISAIAGISVAGQGDCI